MQLERVIWFAIASSTLIYASIAILFGNPPRNPSFDQAVRTQVTLLLYGIAALEFVAATMITMLMRDRPPRVRMIIGLAMYEGCAIFGLVAAFLGHDWRLYIAPWGLAVIGFIRVFPAGEGS